MFGQQQHRVCACKERKPIPLNQKVCGPNRFDFPCKKMGKKAEDEKEASSEEDVGDDRTLVTVITYEMNIELKPEIGDSFECT